LKRGGKWRVVSRSPEDSNRRTSARLAKKLLGKTEKMEGSGSPQKRAKPRSKLDFVAHPPTALNLQCHD